MGTVTVLLGEVDPFTADMRAPSGEAGASFSLDAADPAATASPGVGRFALAAAAPGQPLRDREIGPVIAWAEAQCDARPGLTRVASAVVPTFLRVVVECDLRAALIRRGRRIVLVGGRRSGTPDDARAARDCLAALAGQGVDTVLLAPRYPAPGCRRAAELEVAPAFRAAARAGLRFADAAFGPAERLAAIAGVELTEAVALQLQFVERAAAFRGALWPGVWTLLDARLSARAGELRRQGSSAPSAVTVSARIPPGDGAPAAGAGEMLALRPDAAGLEMRPPRLGEAVALVPVYDPATGASGLIPMSPRVADALHPPRSAPLLAPPRCAPLPAPPRPSAQPRPSVLDALLLRMWRR